MLAWRQEHGECHIIGVRAVGDWQTNQQRLVDGCCNAPCCRDDVVVADRRNRIAERRGWRWCGFDQNLDIICECPWHGSDASAACRLDIAAVPQDAGRNEPGMADLWKVDAAHRRG